MAGSGIALETLERAPAPPPGARRATAAPTKPAPPRPKGTAEKASPQRKGGAMPLDGDWAMQSGVFNGVAMNKDMAAWVRRTTSGGETKVTAGPQVMVHARFTIDTAQTPHAIDYANLSGATKGKAQAGILDLRDGLLRICMAAPGKLRPADFGSKKGDDRSFTTWRRA